jgi:hypothetical protein
MQVTAVCSPKIQDREPSQGHTQQINAAIDATGDEDSDAVAAAAGRAFLAADDAW